MLELGITVPMVATSISTSAFLRESSEELRTADAAGLRYCLVPEHHRGPANSISDPLTVVTWLLAQTERIRIGSGVLLLPLHHPAGIAERAALLQHASAGRLVLGVGAGYQQDDFELFDVPHERRSADFEDNLVRLRGHLGRDSDGLRTIPHVADELQPPLWVGAWSGLGLRRAAALGDAWIADPTRSVQEISDMAARYRHECALRGVRSRTVVMREVWVGETDDEAWRTYLPFVSPVFEYYARKGALKVDVAGGADVSRDLESIVRERAIVGGLDTVYERLQVLEREAGADVVICTLRQPAGPSNAQVLDGIQALGQLQHCLDERG